jgi:hypothetical protein
MSHTVNVNVWRNRLNHSQNLSCLATSVTQC